MNIPPFPPDIHPGQKAAVQLLGATDLSKVTLGLKNIGKFAVTETQARFAVGVLEGALRDEVAAVRETAAETLGELARLAGDRGPEELREALRSVVTPLQRIVEGDGVQRAAKSGLAALARFIPEAADAFMLANGGQTGHSDGGEVAETPRQEDCLQQPPAEQTLEQLAAAYQRVAAEIDVSRKDTAARLQPHLNAYVKVLPQATYEEKHTVAKWINAELRPRGMALKCPNTDVASLVQAESGDYPEVGRFQFFHLEGGKQVRTASRTTLPDLELMPADLGLAPREEQEAGGWAAATNRRRSTKRPRGKS
jgi:hypothetical protein